jgi:hypothetical protein
MLQLLAGCNVPVPVYVACVAWGGGGDQFTFEDKEIFRSPDFRSPSFSSRVKLGESGKSRMEHRERSGHSDRLGYEVSTVQTGLGVTAPK